LGWSQRVIILVANAKIYLQNQIIVHSYKCVGHILAFFFQCINNYNNFLILFFFKCEKKTKNGHIFIHAIVNMLEYISKQFRINLMNKKHIKKNLVFLKQHNFGILN